MGNRASSCWTSAGLFSNRHPQAFVVQLFRTARKRNASVWGISQTPEDFVGTLDRPNEHGAARQKCDDKDHRQTARRYDCTREHVHLNETALNQIKTFAHPKKGTARVPHRHWGKGRIHPFDPGCSSAVDYWYHYDYARERHYRSGGSAAQELPLIRAYEQLAEQYPAGLAEIGLSSGAVRGNAGGTGEMNEETNQMSRF